MRTFIISVYIGLLSNLSFGQSVAADKPVSSPVSFQETSFDFGEIAYGGNGTHEFLFRNGGTEAFTITNVRSSCGCTIPEWPKEPINPGTSGKILVNYDTKREGVFSKTITVYSSASENPIILTIKGEVGPRPPVEETGAEKE
jgi:hypothetical protein